MNPESTGGGLYEALRAFQQNAPHIPLDSINPHFRSRFASLPEIMKIVRPALAKHGLVWITKPSSHDGQPTLKYALVHAATGERDEGEMPLLLTRRDSQSIGSAITYARRYALLAVTGLVGDQDDDGNANTTTSQPAPAEKVATAAQRNLIQARANEARLSSVHLAHIVLAAAGYPPKQFADEDAARQWTGQALARLPARLVDPILERIPSGVIGPRQPERSAAPYRRALAQLRDDALALGVTDQEVQLMLVAAGADDTATGDPVHALNDDQAQDLEVRLTKAMHRALDEQAESGTS